MKLPNVVTMEFLLHSYHSSLPYPRPYPTHLEGRDWLLVNGLIRTDPCRADVYDCTPRGNLLVRMLLDTPLPELKYVDPRPTP